MTIEDRPNSGAISRAKRGSGTRGLDAALDRIFLDRACFLMLLIVLGVVALAWILFLSVLLSGRPRDRRFR